MREMKKLLGIVFLSILTCNISFADNLVYLKCIGNKYSNEIFIKINFEDKKLGFAIESTPVNLDFKVTKITEDLIIGKNEAVSFEQTYDDGTIYQANDSIVIDRIIGSAKLVYETLKDTRKESTPNPYIIIPIHYWKAKDCKKYEPKKKF
tara:strand:+ start:527 stop:976 length:450 start_codon:yes stop_codon:yes gene_type:complete